MIKEFNSIDKTLKYYNESTDTYVFKEDDKYIDLVVFNFNLNVGANIEAMNITAQDINARNIKAADIKANDIHAWNITAWDITAIDITARDIKAKDITSGDIHAVDIHAVDIHAVDIHAKDINYYGVCCAYGNIKCKSIKGRRKNAKHFVLDGKIEIKEK